MDNFAPENQDKLLGSNPNEDWELTELAQTGPNESHQPPTGTGPSISYANMNDNPISADEPESSDQSSNRKAVEQSSDVAPRSFHNNINDGLGPTTLDASSSTGNRYESSHYTLAETPHYSSGSFLNASQVTRTGILGGDDDDGNDVDDDDNDEDYVDDDDDDDDDLYTPKDDGQRPPRIPVARTPQLDKPVEGTSLRGTAAATSSYRENLQHHQPQPVFTRGCQYMQQLPPPSSSPKYHIRSRMGESYYGVGPPGRTAVSTTDPRHPRVVNIPAPRPQMQYMNTIGVSGHQHDQPDHFYGHHPVDESSMLLSSSQDRSGANSESFSSPQMLPRAGKLRKKKSRKFNLQRGGPLPAVGKHAHDVGDGLEGSSSSGIPTTSSGMQFSAPRSKKLPSRQPIRDIYRSTGNIPPHGMLSLRYSAPPSDPNQPQPFEARTETESTSDNSEPERHIPAPGSIKNYDPYFVWPEHGGQPVHYYEPAPAAEPSRYDPSMAPPADPNYPYAYAYDRMLNVVPMERFYSQSETPPPPHEEQQAQAELRIVGNLRHITRNWTNEEIHSGRRLVFFQRIQHGARVDLHFEAIDAKDYDSNMCVISCILRKDTNEFYVTSVDCITLLELIINQRFSVEEKNRIRRNLEVCRPITVSKSKPGLEQFFRQIMSFGAPRPRNIEKDVKVFLWDNLHNALQKIVAKYSASWNAND